MPSARRALSVIALVFCAAPHAPGAVKLDEVGGYRIRLTVE